MNYQVIATDVRTVEVQQVEMPTPGPGQVLIRTSKTAISTGTELTMLMADFPEGGRWDRMTKFPHRPGYCHVGRIVEVGQDVEGYSVGDRVATAGGHATWVVMDAAQLFPVPDGLADDVAALWMLGRIAFNGVRRGEIQMGESVAVFGLGLIGLFAGQLARISGARPVIGVDISPLRRRFAQQCGFDVVLDGAAEDLSEHVAEATRGRMLDCVLEVTGVAALIPREMDLLHKQGRIVIVSSPRGKTQFDFHDYVNSPSLTIIGAHNGSHPPVETWYNQWTPQRNTQILFDLMVAGEVRARHLITHRFHWRDAPAAYQMLMEDRTQAGAVILDWSD